MVAAELCHDGAQLGELGLYQRERAGFFAGVVAGEGVAERETVRLQIAGVEGRELVAEPVVDVGELAAVRDQAIVIRHDGDQAYAQIAAAWHPQHMKRAALYAELASIRRVVREATARFEALAAGVDHPRVDTARQRLQSADLLARRAAGGLSLATRTSIDVVVIMVVGWTVATVAGIVLDPGWTIAVTVVVLLASFWPTYRLLNHLGRRVDERRTRVGEPTRSDGDLVRLLESARYLTQQTMDAWIASHHYRAAAGSVSGLRWLSGMDVPVYNLRHLEVCLCQAIDSVQIWRADVEAHQ